MDDILRGKLEETSCGEVLFDRLLARYTTFGIGGPADALVIVNKRQELTTLLTFLGKESIAWRVIGKGSNLLISDNGYRGVVILLGKECCQIEEIKQVDDKKVVLHVGAGCSLTKLNHYCCKVGFGGMEFSYGIPGTLGGAVLMNAGAWGKEMAEVITEVGVITHSGYEKLAGEKLDFTYRKWPSFSSYIGRGVIADVTLSLTADSSESVKEKSSGLLKKRYAIQPHNFPNAGSVFKNPKGKSAGLLIEASGLKGESVGGAMVSNKHANFIINKKHATANDVQALMRIVQNRVKEHCNVELEPELHVM